jgi:hypothetical protein
MAQPKLTGPSDGQAGPHRPPSPPLPPVAPQPAPNHHQDPPLAFWQGRFAQSILPIMASLALHMGLILVGLATLHAIKVVIVAPATQPYAVDLDLDWHASNAPGARGDQVKLGVNQGLDTSPFAIQDLIDNDRHGIVLVPGPDDGAQLPRGDLEAGAVQVPRTVSISTSGPGRIPFGVGAAGSGIPDSMGPGGWPPAIAGPTRRLSPTGQFPGRDSIFDPPPEQQRQPIARSVIFVCDASGSMLDNFDLLRVELNKAIVELRPVQMFSIVLFQEQRFMAIDRGQLMPATPENRRRAAEFLNDISARGRTDPIPALDLALRQRPELIHLLTDGDFMDNDVVLGFIRRRAGGSRINTIAFISRGERYEGVLQAIARETGGWFKYVSEEDVSGR